MPCSIEELNSFVALRYNIDIKQWAEGKDVLPLTTIFTKDGPYILKILVPGVSELESMCRNIMCWVALSIPQLSIMKAIYTFKETCNE